MIPPSPKGFPTWIDPPALIVMAPPPAVRVPVLPSALSLSSWRRTLPAAFRRIRPAELPCTSTRPLVTVMSPDVLASPVAVRRIVPPRVVSLAASRCPDASGTVMRRAVTSRV